MNQTIAEAEGSWVVGSVLRALEMGLTDHACEVYEESGAEAANDILAAIKASKREVVEAGARMFAVARDFSRAARLYENLRDLPAAAQQYEAAGEMEYAGRCHERLGDARRAAGCYDAAGTLDKAIALYERIGDKADAARCLLRGGRGLQAAKAYRELGNARGEVDALRAVRGDTADRLPAARRLLEILLGRNRAAEATQVVADAVRESVACRHDRGILEQLAELYDRQGQHAGAGNVRARIAELGATPQTASAPKPPAAIAPDLSLARTVADAPVRDGYGFLKAIPLFAKLSLEDMKELYRLTTEVSFAPGEVLIEQGTDGRGLFIVLEGTLDILLMHAEGAKKLNTLGPGAYVGEVSLLGRSRTSARVAALEAVDALHIPPEQFEHFLNGRPQAALRVYRLFAENLAERVRALSNR
jgi:tetratricopeptide (TPR) repeat protein